jgi:transposase, IS5 family
MRLHHQIQDDLGNVPICDIQFNLKSRDDIPKLLMALQYVYCTKELKDTVLGKLDAVIPKKINRDMGRPGMNLWRILVLGTLRFGADCDFDRLKELVDHHSQVRQMLGFGAYDTKVTISLQSIRDNVKLLTPELLDEINQVIVGGGHALVKKNEENELRVRADSFVVKTDVHYPTDSNLLYDAVRKIIQLSAKACKKAGLSVFRQSKYNLKKVKETHRKLTKIHHSTSRNPKKREAKREEIKAVTETYLKLCEGYVERAKELVEMLDALSMGTLMVVVRMEIAHFIGHAERQIDQLRRRVIDGENIPHEEKVFSIFEEHTEWISKGKAGVPQELGVRVALVEDQYKFILHHQVMYRKTDEKITVELIKASKKRFGNLKSASFDKGFYAPEVLKDLQKEVALAVLPKRGRLNKEERERESDPEFRAQRNRHAGIESAIHALHHNGLDRCPDHGKKGFSRYVALAVVARNLLTLGSILFEQKRLKLKKAA